MQSQQTIVKEGIQELERYNKAIEGNKNYVQKKLDKDPDYFKKLAKGQSPKYLLIGCSDSRAPPNELTETDPGEIFIHRNIANLVIPTDLNLNCVIQYAVEHLKVHSIIIMGHTRCGGIQAALQQDSCGGLLDLWLNQIKLIYEKHQNVVDSFEQEEDRINSLCCMNVREQMINIWRNPIIQKSWQDGHPVMVHGWLFKVETGLIDEISLESSIPEEMSKIFKLKFKKEHAKQSSRGSSPKHSITGGSPSYRKSFQRMQSQLELCVKQCHGDEEYDLSIMNGEFQMEKSELSELPDHMEFPDQKEQSEADNEEVIHDKS